MVTNSGPRRTFAERLLDEAIPLSTPAGKLDPLIRVPVPYRFSWRRRPGINIPALFAQRGNGLATLDVLTLEGVEEEHYQQWLLKTGFNGRNAGTRPEYMVSTQLERMGYHAPWSDVPGLDFENAFLNSAVGVDIDVWVHFTAPETAIRVQGEYFHFADDPTIVADDLERAQLESLGLRVVDILGQDTWNRQRCEWVVRLALEGFEVEPSGKIWIVR